MLDLRKNMILIDGKIRTSQIQFCYLNNSKDKYIVVFKNSPENTYLYSRDKIIWLTNPILFNPHDCHIYHNGDQLHYLNFIASFQYGFYDYWYVEYFNGAHKSFRGNEISIVQSCITDKKAKDIFEYLRNVASKNSLKSEIDNIPLLLKQYDKIDFIGDDCAAAPYLNPEKFKLKQYSTIPLIYPFGCNASQQKAVQAAFENQISIIQGPPGTGKTQTILNIVANIIQQGKTVMVVSNNNSAISNVIEKMERYDMGFITALLGNQENKDSFFRNQETEKAIPTHIEQWHSDKADQPYYLKSIDDQALALAEIFAKQERLTIARQELDALKIEHIHFEQENEYDKRITIRKQLSSSQLMELWNELQAYLEKLPYSGFAAKFVNAFYNYWLNYLLHKTFSGIAQNIPLTDIVDFIPIIQDQFYKIKSLELTDEIKFLEQFLASRDANQMMKQLQDDSMCYLRNILFHKYGENHQRPIFSHCTKSEDLIQEFPVILSTTFSSRSSLSNETILDYVIMDEASQISSETGVLALMCARNAVVVGDSKQLPNVITQEDKMQIQSVTVNCNVDKRYDCAQNSFLQSICQILPDAPQTLLREHYRCHPKIINFCNLKFYGGKLIIMTKDNGEENVISATRTVVGNHSRKNMNQREIDVITKEILPTLSYPKEDIGIITPYNMQVDELTQTLEGSIDVATVHKFQGREKDAIIMSTVDDMITEFSDNPNLLNVAISRAKKKFCLVVSGNEQPKDCNISDLLAYIMYNNCTVTDSNIHSIFDLLYNQYAEARNAYLKKHKRISEYESENLTFAMLEQIIDENQDFSHLGIVYHQPLRQLVRKTTGLSKEEITYIQSPKTHIDFLLYNRVSKQPVLAIETDGYEFHNIRTAQHQRDEKKNHILSILGIPLIRLSTTGSDEHKKVIEAIMNAIQK